LLRIAQIETKSRRAKFKELDLSALVRDVLETYQPVLEDAGMSLVALANLDSNRMVRGDAQLLVQMVSNLVENCIRHCPPGTTITCEMKNPSDRVCLSIADNGPGIPAEEYDLVLQRLYRLEKSRTTPGSGLGLSLVKAVTDLHEAELSLEDNHPGLRISVNFSVNASAS